MATGHYLAGEWDVDMDGCGGLPGNWQLSRERARWTAEGGGGCPLVQTLYTNVVHVGTA